MTRPQRDHDDQSSNAGPQLETADRTERLRRPASCSLSAWSSTPAPRSTPRCGTYTRRPRLTATTVPASSLFAEGGSARHLSIPGLFWVYQGDTQSRPPHRSLATCLEISAKRNAMFTLRSLERIFRLKLETGVNLWAENEAASAGGGRGRGEGERRAKEGAVGRDEEPAGAAQQCCSNGGGREVKQCKRAFMYPPEYHGHSFGDQTCAATTRPVPARLCYVVLYCLYSRIGKSTSSSGRSKV